MEFDFFNSDPDDISNFYNINNNANTAEQLVLCDMIEPHEEYLRAEQGATVRYKGKETVINNDEKRKIWDEISDNFRKKCPRHVERSNKQVKQMWHYMKQKTNKSKKLKANAVS